jgi:hypothetical protein
VVGEEVHHFSDGVNHDYSVGVQPSGTQ